MIDVNEMCFSQVWVNSNWMNFVVSYLILSRYKIRNWNIILYYATIQCYTNNKNIRK